MPENPLGEEKPPLAQLEAVPSCQVAFDLVEDTNPLLTTASF